jgi:transcriptional repressor NrdR
MVCTYCGSATQVNNSRHQRRVNNVWRRRKCLSCGNIFSTIEQVDYEKSWVVQYADSVEQPFMQDKLLISLYKTCQHRPSALPDALGLTATVMGGLQKIMQHGSVTSTAIATMAHGTLQRFDKAAATMYRAYHEDVL